MAPPRIRVELFEDVWEIALDPAGMAAPLPSEFEARVRATYRDTQFAESPPRSALHPARGAGAGESLHGGCERVYAERRQPPASARGEWQQACHRRPAQGGSRVGAVPGILLQEVTV